MTTVNDIFAEIDRIAPFDTQLDYDRAGFLVGNGGAKVEKALLAMDVTNGVIDEAVSLGCELIITHHPVIWDPIKRLMSGSIVYRLAKADISVICAHTNLDAADGGVNDCLAQALGLTNCRHAESVEIGTVGELERVMTAQELAEHVKKSLGCGAVKFTRGSKMIKHVAVVGGAGGDYAPAICAAEADALITGEAKHNELIDAVNADITLIVAGHHETEVVVLPKLAELLHREFPETEFLVSAEPSPAAVI